MTSRLFVLATSAVLAIPLAAAPPAEKGKGDPAKGKAIFTQCSVCHNPDSDVKKVGPGLKGLFKRDKLINGKKVTEANVRAMINAGGNGMPPYQELLSDAEKDSVIAFLKTL